MMSTRRLNTEGSLDPVCPIGSCCTIAAGMPSATSWSATIEARVIARYLLVCTVPVALARAWTVTDLAPTCFARFAAPADGTTLEAPFPAVVPDGDWALTANATSIAAARTAIGARRYRTIMSPHLCDPLPTLRAAECMRVCLCARKASQLVPPVGKPARRSRHHLTPGCVDGNLMRQRVERPRRCRRAKPMAALPMAMIAATPSFGGSAARDLPAT